MSRDDILNLIEKNQAPKTHLPDLSVLGTENFGLEKYKEILEQIGGKYIEIADIQQVIDFVKNNKNQNARIISTIKELKEIAETNWLEAEPHSLQNVDLAIFKAQFGVAENAALWLTDQDLGQRIAPFITQHLAIILQTDAIVPTMHQAYQLISEAEYGFGTFIAGPSKTADIEQSLVLGAHGARSLTVFLLRSF
jgi:L-lactate dehydrogenase complex protein LldG